MTRPEQHDRRAAAQSAREGDDRLMAPGAPPRFGAYHPADRAQRPVSQLEPPVAPRPRPLAPAPATALTGGALWLHGAPAGTVRVAALIKDRRDRARLHDGLPPGVVLVSADTIGGLEAALRDLTAPLGAVLVEPTDHEGRAVAPWIAPLVAAHQEIPWVALCDGTSSSSLALVDLVRAGVVDVVFRTSGAYEVAWGPVLARASRAAVIARITTHIAPHLAPSGQAVFHHALALADRPATPEDLARSLGLSRSTLLARCRAAGLQAPEALLRWAKILAAAALLEEPTRTIECIAPALGLQSATVLRNLFRRYTGLTASTLRQQGGLTRAIASWAAMRPAHARQPTVAREREHP